MKTFGIRVKSIVPSIYYKISCKMTKQEDAEAKSGKSHDQLFTD